MSLPSPVAPLDLAILAEIWDEFGLCPCCGGMPRQVTGTEPREENEMADKEIRTAKDADDIREDVEKVYDGWFAERPRIDWEDFLDRLEDRGYDLGDDLLSPAVKQIKAIVRELRAS